MTALIFGVILGLNLLTWATIGDLRGRVDKLAKSVLTLCEALQHLATALNAVQAIMKEERGRWN